MSRQQQDEHEAWMFGTYGDFNVLVMEEGLQNVLQDLEDHFPGLYELLIQGVIERAKIKREPPCALLSAR